MEMQSSKTLENKMVKVQVLLSAYNSVSFFDEQLDSLLQQENVQVSILIRDDGSKNEEMERIIKSYQGNPYSISIEYYRGENLGPAKSFIDLIAKADKNCDYFAFCDHDDIWDSDKLMSAVRKLDRLNPNEPNCYFCNYRLCDENGTVIGQSNLPNCEYEVSASNLLLCNMAPGCCMVFNRQVVRLIQSKPVPQNMVMHDTWVILLCSMLGNVVYDSVSHTSYRQHGANMIGVATDFVSKIRFKRNYLLNREGQKNHYEQFIEFEKDYRDMIKDPQRACLLQHLCQYEISRKSKMFLLAKLKSYSKKTEYYYKICLLLGAW